MGPDDMSQSLTSTDDIGVHNEADSGSAEVTSGQLYWADSQTGCITYNS